MSEVLKDTFSIILGILIVNRLWSSFTNGFVIGK